MFVSFGAPAFEVSWQVDALGGALAAAWDAQAFVVVDALVGVDVVDVTSVALAFEGAGGVHAAPVGTHGGHQGAFVDFFSFVRHRVDDLTGTLTAEGSVFDCERKVSCGATDRGVQLTSPLRGARCTGLPPALPHGAAAKLLRQALRRRVRARATVVLQITSLLPHIDAFLCKTNHQQKFPNHPATYFLQELACILPGRRNDTSLPR